MTTTFIHVGDLHLHPGPRQDDRLRALDQIIDGAIALPDLGAWAIPGDLYHRRSTVEDRNALAPRIVRMAELAPVWIVPGNHDAPGDLDILAGLHARWPITVANVPRVTSLAVASGALATVFFLPWPTEAGLVGDGVPPAEIGQRARTDLEAIFRDAGARLAEARGRGEITLMIGHADVTGAVSSSGQPSIGPGIALDGALLGLLGPCPKLLNHIHRAQRIDDAWYAGSCCRLDWGEIEPKTYNVVQFGTVGAFGEPNGSAWLQAGAWGYVIERHKLDVPPMYHVEGEMSANGFSWHVADGPDGTALLAVPQSWKGADVRVRMRYRQREGALLAMQQAEVRAIFKEARRFEFEPVCVPDRGLRAPDVAMARTLPEKLAAWAEATHVVLPADAATLAGRLEAEDLDALGAAVEREMLALGDLRQEVE